MISSRWSFVLLFSICAVNVYSAKISPLSTTSFENKLDAAKAQTHWLTKRHSKHDKPKNKHDKSSAAAYLPPRKPICIRKKSRGSFQKWYNEFIRQQQKWCGKPTAPIKFSPKQYKFTDAREQSWPWMVSFYQVDSYQAALFRLFQDLDLDMRDLPMTPRPPFGPKHICAGTLISPEFILTAAHCVQYWKYDAVAVEDQIRSDCVIRQIVSGKQIDVASCDAQLFSELDARFTNPDLTGAPLNTTKLWQIWVGAHLTPPDGVSGREGKVKIHKIKNIRHFRGANTLEKLFANGFENDIAIVQLEKPITKFSDSIKPICLTDKYDKSVLYKGDPHHRCAVAGWGDYFGSDGILYESERLQNAPYKILNSEKKCMQKTKDYPALLGGDNMVNTHRTLCAEERYPHRKKTPGVKTKVCAGDSGGPLICRYKDGRWYQVGIISHGKGETEYTTCEIEAAPDVFTKVSSYTNWILKSMYEMSRDTKYR